ncbi:5426_t:CDS:2 [Funneliformis mosseae]|uniref:5426_t:CDS:1 n=1 Tax=Funneliformis mosseae TaxID=27381 RepID=A0A9N9B7P6_FUNMO|nr:5426_t:CDS:2 [Funneliformis mosseae]
MREDLERLDPREWGWEWLWTQYEHRRTPKPSTGSELNKQLIESYGIAFEYCINDASTLLLKELFDTNIIATAQKKFDFNFHPVGLVTGAQGIGKSRLLMECVNHIRKRFPGFLKDLVDLINLPLRLLPSVLVDLKREGHYFQGSNFHNTQRVKYTIYRQMAFGYID